MVDTKASSLKCLRLIVADGKQWPTFFFVNLWDFYLILRAKTSQLNALEKHFNVVMLVVIVMVLDGGDARLRGVWRKSFVGNLGILLLRIGFCDDLRRVN